MPVVPMACPKCGRQATEYDADKWQCLHCGIKFVYKEEKAPVINIQQIYQKEGETVRPVLCCPKCGNANVQFKKIVYEAGTHTSSGTGLGLDLSGGVGVGVWGGQSVSLLASRCKPPENTAWLHYFLIVVVLLFELFVGLIIGSNLGESSIPPSLLMAVRVVGLVFLILLMVVSAIGLGKLAERESDHYQQNVRRWAETVICLTCGQEFLTPRGLQGIAADKELLERKEQLESERQARRSHEWEESKKALGTSLANTQRGVSRFAVGAPRQIDRLLWTMAGGEENTLLHHFLLVLTVCILAGVISWFVAFRDTWELHNADRLSATLEEADRLQQSDPLAACKAYDEVLNEARQHKITATEFAQKLAIAERSRTTACQRAEERTRVQEAEKRRLAEAEQQRVVQVQERMRAKQTEPAKFEDFQALFPGYEAGAIKRIGDVDVVLACDFSTIYVPHNASVIAKERTALAYFTGNREACSRSPQWGLFPSMGVPKRSMSKRKMTFAPPGRAMITAQACRSVVFSGDNSSADSGRRGQTRRR